MITDHLANGHRYAALGARLAQAFAFLQRPDLLALADGRYDIDGDALYALVQRYTSKLPGQGRWEAHQRYADLQLVAAGREQMGCGAMARFTRGTYDPAKDIEFLTGDGDFVLLGAGDFIVLWPGEVHMPGMAAGEPGEVTKVVIKIRMD
jgi:YhcH/YjgK/YiaL family protein